MKIIRTRISKRGFLHVTSFFIPYWSSAAIISAAAAEQIAEPWVAQLAVGGRLIAPVREPDGEGQALHRIERLADDEWQHAVLDPVRFVPLRSGTVR